MKLTLVNFFPPEMVRYGVTFVSECGDENLLSDTSSRWNSWSEAASFGERKVKEGAARGFRIFKEAAVLSHREKK
jgi:hypothetical protein